MWRQLVIDGIEKDPAWQNGNYTSEPQQGLRTAESILFIAGGAPLYLQQQYPTREAATAFVEQSVARAIPSLDANDMIYQFDSSRNYNPWPKLERIKVPLTWINSADDFINPRNLPVPQQALKRMPTARFRLIPESPETHGHGTHTWAKFWKGDLSALLARSEPR
jgi:homoserine O-acetyltransferase